MYIFVFLTAFIFCGFSLASEFDEELANALKMEANHNLNRIKNYKTEVKNNKIFNEEREKGLAEFLEEQEKYDLMRERGLRDYRNQKKIVTPEEGSAEHRQYLKEKRAAEKTYEDSLKLYIKTRNKYRSQQIQEVAELESEELGLNKETPRYVFSKRSRNKWLTTGAQKGFSGVTASPAPTYEAPVPQVSDYQPAQEFPAAPPPYEGFDEIPPPPPLYDTSGGIPYDPSYDSGSGIPQIPPPPPPPPDYDF